MNSKDTAILEYAKYVENCRQNGIEIANSKNININNNSSLSQVITNFNRLEAIDDNYDPFEDNRPYRAYTDYRWKGAPDLHPIMDAAQPIEKDGIMYYPIYICLERASELEPIYKTGTTSGNKTAPNYLNSYGGDAYIFSDNPEELVVGTAFTYKWDNTKDFGEGDKKTHWILVYSATENKLTGRPFSVYKNVIEIIVGNFENNSSASPNFPQGGYANVGMKSLEYLEYGEKTNLTYSFRGSSNYDEPENAVWNNIKVLNFKGTYNYESGTLLNLSRWYKCPNFLIAYIPKDIVELEKIAFASSSDAFRINSPIIKTLDLNNFISKNTLSINNISNSPYVETIIFPNDIYEIKLTNTSLFAEMPNLKNIIWGNNLKKISKLYIPTSIKNLKLPEGIEEVQIDSSSNEKYIDFPKSLKILKIGTVLYSKNNCFKIPENLNNFVTLNQGSASNGIVPNGGYIELYHH